jgi:cytochrome c-type biogenesis protein CcmH/NrfG
MRSCRRPADRTDVPRSGTRQHRGACTREPVAHCRPVNARRIIGVIVVGLVVAGGVIGGAVSLGGTTQLASPDPAQPIVVGVVAAPGEELTGPTELPPLAMVVDEAVPDAIANLSPSAQVARYRADARDDDARSLVRLAAAQQRAGQQDAAADTYRRAQAASPNDLAPAIGLAMADAASGDAGMARATTALARLTRANPASQLAWFNRGWLATYRRDGPGVISAWKRVVEIDPGTPIGRTATALLTGIADRSSGGGG